MHLFVLQQVRKMALDEVVTTGASCGRVYVQEDRLLTVLRERRQCPHGRKLLESLVRFVERSL